MSEWMQELSLLAAADFHGRRIVGALATTCAENIPHNRMVVLRQLDTYSNSIWTTTDARSLKTAQLIANPLAELVVWAQSERTQFRVRGNIELIQSGSGYLDTWQGLSDRDRAMFQWPMPGAAWVPGLKLVETVPASAVPAENFRVFVLRATEAEALELNENPHRRRIWRKANDWNLERINP